MAKLHFKYGAANSDKKDTLIKNSLKLRHVGSKHHEN
jgi:hypothetical protein